MTKEIQQTWPHNFLSEEKVQVVITSFTIVIVKHYIVVASLNYRRRASTSCHGLVITTLIHSIDAWAVCSLITRRITFAWESITVGNFSASTTRNWVTPSNPLRLVSHGLEQLATRVHVGRGRGGGVNVVWHPPKQKNHAILFAAAAHADSFKSGKGRGMFVTSSGWGWGARHFFSGPRCVEFEKGRQASLPPALGVRWTDRGAGERSPLELPPAAAVVVHYYVVLGRSSLSGPPKVDFS